MNNTRSKVTNIAAACLFIICGLYLGYRTIIQTPSVNITTEIQESKDFAAKQPLDKTKYKNKAEQVLAAGRQAMKDWAAEVRAYRQEERKKAKTKNDKDTLKVITPAELGTPAGQALLNEQITLVTNAVIACQNQGNMTGTQLRTCLCSKLSCDTSPAAANFAKNISESSPQTLDSGHVLECLEYTQAVINNLIAKGDRPNLIACSGLPAKEYGAKCLDANNKGWWYCEIPANRVDTVVLKSDDLINFGESGGGDAGHIGIVNCAKGSDTANNCNMIDANAQKDGHVQNHPVTDYSAKPKGFFRYSPQGYPDANLVCKLHKS